MPLRFVDLSGLKLAGLIPFYPNTLGSPLWIFSLALADVPENRVIWKLGKMAVHFPLHSSPQKSHSSQQRLQSPVTALSGEAPLFWGKINSFSGLERLKRSQESWLLISTLPQIHLAWLQAPFFEMDSYSPLFKGYGSEHFQGTFVMALEPPFCDRLR